MDGKTLRRIALCAALAVSASAAATVASDGATVQRNARAQHPAPTLPLRREESVTSSSEGWADRSGEQHVPVMLGLFDEESELEEDCGCGGGWLSHDSCIHLRDPASR